MERRTADAAVGAALGGGVDMNGGAGVGGGKRGKGGEAILVRCQGRTAGGVGERGGLCDVGGDDRHWERHRRGHRVGWSVGASCGLGESLAVFFAKTGRLISDSRAPLVSRMNACCPLFHQLPLLCA